MISLLLSFLSLFALLVFSLLLWCARQQRARRLSRARDAFGPSKTFPFSASECALLVKYCPKGMPLSMTSARSILSQLGKQNSKRTFDVLTSRGKRGQRRRPR